MVLGRNSEYKWQADSGPTHVQDRWCFCYSWSYKFSLFPESSCNCWAGLGLAVPCSVQLPSSPVLSRSEALPRALPCCFCMVVKSSKVRVRTGGLQNAYVSIMASSPVLEEEQPENQLVSNPKHSLIFEVARGVVRWVTHHSLWETHHQAKSVWESTRSGWCYVAGRRTKGTDSDHSQESP